MVYYLKICGTHSELGFFRKWNKRYKLSNTNTDESDKHFGKKSFHEEYKVILFMQTYPELG